MNGLLPAPKHQYVVHSDARAASSSSSSSSNKAIPPYPNRAKSKFIPMTNDDFGDGGAYPEINVVQYPLGMGKPGNKSTALVTVDVNEKGEVQYDAIVKRNSGSKIVHTTLNDIKEKAGDLTLLRLPSKEEEEKDTDRTKKALEAILQGKISSSNPTTVTAHNSNSEYIRYTPNPNAPGYTAQQRVIKIVSAQVDPLEPPKHAFKKTPKGPGSPPAPVLHSPPRKLTVAEQQAYKIPPCISNYKNVKGYVIPLDQRLAADGRGLQEVTINDKFASVNEALYIAERKAAEDLKIRQQIRQKIAIKEKEDREAQLREMATAARAQRASLLQQQTASANRDNEREREMYNSSRKEQLDGESEEYKGARGDINDRGRREVEDDEAVRERIRMEKRKEAERELRMKNLKGVRKNKEERDGERDISEKIALGMLKGTGKLTGEALFDSRLFNQSAGLDSGFGADDEYNQYSKPLFDRGAAESIYKPKVSSDDVMAEDVEAELQKLREKDTQRFRPDKGFAGADVSMGKRTGPVQFQKATKNLNDSDDERGNRPSSPSLSSKRKGEFESNSDAFGIGDLLEDTSRDKRSKHDRGNNIDDDIERGN